MVFNTCVVHTIAQSGVHVARLRMLCVAQRREKHRCPVPSKFEEHTKPVHG
jgi:predicted alpha/beta-hydrolase family hydrolase